MLSVSWKTCCLFRVSSSRSQSKRYNFIHECNQWMEFRAHRKRSSQVYFALRQLSSKRALRATPSWYSLDSLSARLKNGRCSRDTNCQDHFDFAGLADWLGISLPNWIREFDFLSPLHFQSGSGLVFKAFALGAKDRELKSHPPDQFYLYPSGGMHT